MKRVYTKPDILFESFSLSTGIASCARPINTPAEMTCGIMLDGLTVPTFVSGSSGCTIPAPDGYNSICYHVPTETTNLFNS